MEMLVDTCILLRAFDANSPNYRAIRRSLRQAWDDGIRLVVTVQNMAEFWNVATRPRDKNGHGLSTARVKRRVQIVERLCEVVSEDNWSYAEWCACPRPLSRGFPCWNHGLQRLSAGWGVAAAQSIPRDHSLLASLTHLHPDRTNNRRLDLLDLMMPQSAAGITGSNGATRMPTMATTTNSSIRVNAWCPSSFASNCK
jgi:predicted nucleic acid-binding protein